MNGLRSKRKAQTVEESLNSSKAQTPSRPKPPKEQKLDQSWDDISDDFFSVPGENSGTFTTANAQITPTKNEKVQKRDLKSVRSPFKSVRPQESGIETSPIIQRSRATQLKMADFSTEMDMDEKSDKESAKSNDSDFSDFDDDDFDVSLLETSISKMATQPKSPVIEAHDEWATPPDKKFGTLEYPLTDKQMEEYLRIKRLKDLYQWQKDCLRIRSVIDGKNLIFSLPTSAGKSLVAEVHLLSHLLQGNSTLLILPFVSIVQEKVASMSQLAREIGGKFVVEEYAAGKGRIPPIRRRQNPALFIATIEKASQIVSCAIAGTGPWINCCVIDELHMIGEGIRGARLEGTLARLMYAAEKKSRVCQIIGMSATLPNLNEIANFLEADLFTSDFRPVPLTQYLKLNKFIYSVAETPEKIETKYDRQLKIDPKNALEDPDGIFPLCMEMIPNHSVLIFCPTRRNCQAVTTLLTKQLSELTDFFSDDVMAKRKQIVIELNEEMQDVGGIEKDVAAGLLCGVAFHHAGLTATERHVIEEAFRTGLVNVLCATSTLAAGVNLPARRVIIRSLNQGRDKLPVATYRQMAGRAGRAGFDTMGESIILGKALIKSSFNKLSFEFMFT